MARGPDWMRIARTVVDGVQRARRAQAEGRAGAPDRPARSGEAPTRPGAGSIIPGPGAGPRRDPRRGEVDTAVGRLQISYAPVRDDDADPGEIVWAWVPYEEDPSQGKDRPLLVIGHVEDDVAALAMTSRSHDDRHHHPIGSGPWDRDGRPSWIKLDRLIRLDPDGIRREGVVLERSRFDAVVAAWQAY